MLPSETTLAWVALSLAAVLPTATLATTITIASPIVNGSNPSINLNVYGKNTSSFLNNTYTVYWNVHQDVTPPYLELALDVKTAGWLVEFCVKTLGEKKVNI